MQETQTVADVVADEIRAAGIDRAFGLPGGEILFLMDALRRHGVEFVLCRHEANAGVMAAVYGKLKRIPGLVLTTLGPGAANLLLPISSSLLEREPLLAISAQIPASWPASHTHQRLPLLEIYRPVSKRAMTVERQSCRATMRDAISTCMEEPRGPVYLTVSAEEATATAGTRASEKLLEPTESFELQDPARVARSLRESLDRADRPLVLIGLGVDSADWQIIRNWLDEWHLPFGVTPKVKGIVDEGHDGFVGVFGGMAIDRLMLEALQRSDLLVGLGLDPVELDKTWHADAPIVWLLQSLGATGAYPSSAVLPGRHRPVLECLLAEDPPREWEGSFDDVRERRRQIAQGKGSARLPGVSPLSIVRVLAAALPSETIVTTDVGSHKYIFGQFWPSRHPDTFWMSNGLSGMGYGLPASIGAKLARPDQPVLAVLGDGGFSMNSQELETAKRLGANIVVVVLADRSYSLIKLAQEARGLPSLAVDFERIDAVATASACGVRALRAENQAELAEAAREAQSSEDSLVIEVSVDPHSYKGLV